MGISEKRNVDKIVEFAGRLQRRINSVSRDEFLSDYDIQDNILYAVGQLGENVNKSFDYLIEQKIDEDLLYSLIGMRNRIFHEYDDIDIGIVYDNVKNGIENVLAVFTELQNNS